MDKIIAKDQATLTNKSLKKAVKVGLKEWSVTADGAAIYLSTFEILKCKFSGSYHEIQSYHLSIQQQVKIIVFAK